MDLAVYGCADFTNFSLDVDEKVRTLLMFDILDMDSYEYSQEYGEFVECIGNSNKYRI